MALERLFLPVTGEDLIDREEIINRLLRNFRNIDTPLAQQFALIGSRRIGKTSILREVYRRMKEEPWENMPIPIWLNIARIVKSSGFDKDEFGTKFLAAFTYDYVRHERPDLPLPNWEEMALEQIRDLAEAMGDPVLRNKVIYLLSNDPHKNAPYSAGLIFRDLVRDRGKRFAIIVDEVQDLFLLPDHYGESVLMTFQESFESIYCLHIFTGSAVRIMSCDVFGYASPLFGRVTQMLLDPLKPADDFALMDKLAREFDLTWEEDAQFLLHELAGGHPFYTTCVVSRLAEEGTRHVTPERVREAFLTDLLQGRMFLEFVDRTDPHLKAMGEVEAAVGILKALVNSEENAVSTEDLKPLPGYSFEVLENLARADVIRLNGWSARMLDPAYKMWLRDVYLHLFWGRQSQVDARRSLAATVGRLCNDLGRLYESKVQDVMWFFQRQTVEGRFFGHPGTSVTLPTFEEVARRVTYAERLPEAIEIDVHGHYPHPQFIYAYWFVECKYQEEQPDREDFERLLHKRELFIRFSFQTDITLWFCTKHPLSEELADWAREQGVYFSSEADLEALFAALRAGVSR